MSVSAITTKPIISADSHIMEPPDVYRYIDKNYADQAPRLVRDESGTDVFVLPGMEEASLSSFSVASAASAGIPMQEVKARKTFDAAHRGGWDPVQRLLDQDRDGVTAEVLYPTLGLFMCGHPDANLKNACFSAYNLWLAEYCQGAPERLIGIGQTAMASPQQGIEDLRRIKSLGFRGAMLPGYPAMEDYHSKIYNPFWQAAVDLEMPLSFHILTYKNRFGEVRGPNINNFMSIIRGNQDIIGMLIFGGVFERFPRLKVVCVEADAGWVPHFMYRMDHALERGSAKWREEVKLSRKPSEYFYDNIYVTFQDDVVAFQMRALFNPRRLMWANDFPHPDSTWPGSQKLLAEHTKALTQGEKDAVLHDNVTELYKLETARPM